MKALYGTAALVVVLLTVSPLLEAAPIAYTGEATIAAVAGDNGVLADFLGAPRPSAMCWP